MIFAVAVAAERDINAFLFAKQEHFHKSANIVAAVAVFAYAHGVEFEYRSVCLCGVGKQGKVDCVSRVVGVTDNID